MTNSEKAAYIRGLMEGMDLDPNAKETKLFNAIVDLLDEGSIDCPNCGETLEFDLEEDDSCDCGENCDCNKE